MPWRGTQPWGVGLGGLLVLAAALGTAAAGGGPAARGVPVELLDPAGGPAVLPVTAPDGYRYEGTTGTAAGGMAQSRTVLLRPASLEHEPTVSLCVDVSPQQRSCPAGALVRQVDGVSVRITLRGPGGRAARELWRTVALTSDPARSRLFDG